MNVTYSQITDPSTVCLTAYTDLDDKNVQVRIADPLWGEFTGDSWIARTKGQ